jgi:hypothetical protein
MNASRTMVTKDQAEMIKKMAPNEYAGFAKDSGAGASGFMLDAAAVQTGGAFLASELEKLNPKIIEPLSAVTYQEDMPFNEGGGWVDFTSNFFVDYGTAANEEDSIIGTNTNDIPTSQAAVSKDVFKVWTFAEALKYSYIDMQKSNKVGRDLKKILDGGLRLNYNKMLDKNTYKGITKLGTYGLVNNPNVGSQLAANNAAGTSRLWKDKSGQEILDDVNTLAEAIFAACEYDPSGIPNQLLIPVEDMIYISRPMTVAGCNSILEYIKENYFGLNYGVQLVIKGRRWCTGAGAGSTNRMVMYKNDEDVVVTDITVPLMPVMTQFVPTQLSYLTPYVSQVGEAKFLRLQPIRYMDGI